MKKKTRENKFRFSPENPDISGGREALLLRDDALSYRGKKQLREILSAMTFSRRIRTGVGGPLSFSPSLCSVSEKGTGSKVSGRRISVNKAGDILDAVQWTTNRAARSGCLLKS